MRKGLASLIEHYNVDLVVANAENAAAGRGITREIGDALLGWGVDVMTSGNHIWAQRETADYIGVEPRLLRPANFPTGVPGNGSYVARTANGRPVGIINVMGRVFMQSIDDPFARVQEEIDAIRGRTRVILVDFHAEATSEKVAMGWYLDGKVTAVICHATCILLKTTLSSGRLLVEGKTWTGFADSEEQCADAFVGRRIQPFWIETEARKLPNTNFIVSGRFRSHAIRDGNLVTGQQQYSGAEAARLVVEAVGL